MVTSREYFEWHLTPEGWVEGSQKTDFGSFKKEPPQDRVLSCEYEEVMVTAFSPIEKDVSITWRMDDEKLISQLQEKYGDFPR